MKRTHQLLLIFLIVLAAFAPSFFAGFSAVDDGFMGLSYRDLQGWDIGNLFIPAIGSGLYYRPFLGLSFRIDKHLLGFEPRLMHMENVLFHLINAFLVCFITLRLLPSDKRSSSKIPLFVSLLFALHPVNAESVNWISGRTDVLAGSFLLGSMLFLLKYRESYRKQHLVLSCMLFLGGALTKETALAFLPGAVLVLTAEGGPLSRTAVNHEQSRDRSGQHPFLTIGGLSLALLVVFFLRSAAFTSSASRIGLTIMAMTDDWMHSMLVILRTLGFYARKLVYPFPLNFVIIEVDPLHEVLAVPLLLLIIYIASRRTVLSGIFMTGIFLMAPAVLIAFGQVAWTPYAERYIYLTSAFFAIATGMQVSRIIPEHRISIFRFGSVVVLLLFFITSFQRSLIWQDDMKLMRDTIAKTPEHKTIRGIYAMQLARKEEYAAAKEQLDRGSTIYEPVYDSRYEFVMAFIYYKQGKIDAAINVIEAVVKKTKGNSRSAFEHLILLLEEKKKSGGTNKEMREIERSIFQNTLRLYALTGDAHLLYDLGVSAERMGDPGRALRLYRQAASNLSSGDSRRMSAIERIDALTRAQSKYHAEKTL